MGSAVSQDHEEWACCSTEDGCEAQCCPGTDFEEGSQNYAYLLSTYQSPQKSVTVHEAR